RPALAWLALLLAGRVDREAGRGRVAARLDDARGGRGEGTSLPDAEHPRVWARRRVRDHRHPHPERAAARRAGDGRGARARAVVGGLAAGARARVGGCVLDPGCASRAHAPMSIVAEIKREGDAAVRRWAVELDGVEPAPAVAEPELLPRDALLALADRVRRWHEAQRPADVSLEVEPGGLLGRRFLPPGSACIYVPRNLG